MVQATSPAPCIIQHLTCLNRFLLPLLFSTLLPSALLFLLPFSLTFHWLKSYGWYGQRALKWNVRKSSFSKICFFFSSVHQLATVLLFFRWPSLRDTSVAQTTRTVTMLNGYPPPTRRLVSRKLRERDLDKSPATVSLDGENLVTMTVHT